MYPTSTCTRAIVSWGGSSNSFPTQRSSQSTSVAFLGTQICGWKGTTSRSPSFTTPTNSSSTSRRGQSDCRDYNVGVLGLMRRFSITEAEAVSGVILHNPLRKSGRDSAIKVWIIMTC